MELNGLLFSPLLEISLEFFELSSVYFKHLPIGLFNDKFSYEMDIKPISVKMVESTSGYSQKLFFTKPPNELLCHICHKVLNGPVNCRNGHMNCLHCITLHVSEHHDCPVCKCIMTEEDLVVSETVQQLIEDMDVGCSSMPVNKESCHWNGKLRDLQAHLHTNCEFHLFQCKHADCTFKVAKRDYQDHLHYHCFKRPTACKYCGIAYPYDSIHSHENTCDRRTPEYLECFFNIPSFWWADLTSGFNEKASVSSESTKLKSNL